MYKYRLNPNKTQVNKLVQTLDVCRNLYNKCLEERINLYNTKGESISAYAQINKSNSYNVGEISTVHSQVIQHTILKLDNSFKQFFTRIKKGDKPGFPRFKGLDRFNSFYYPQSGFRLNDDKHLKLSKIGIVKIKLHRKFEGRIKCLIIKRDSLGHWFACFVVMDNTAPKLKTTPKTSVGLDLGCQSFATFSTGEKIEHPHYYKASESKLAQIQARYSSLKQLPRDNKKKIKTKRLLNKTHNRVQNQRIDFTHKLSSKLINTYDLICVEDLNIKSMTEDNYRNLNKSILDSGWGQFIGQLVYKAEDAGKHVMKVNPAYTSQICSQCGTLVKKELSERTHKCPHCNLMLDRDVNAAINILSFGTKLFKSQDLIEAPALRRG